MPFTSKQKRIYLDTKGNICPYCHVKHINTRRKIRHDYDGTAEQEIECNACGRVWKDVYKLIDIMEENDRRD